MMPQMDPLEPATGLSSGLMSCATPSTPISLYATDALYATPFEVSSR